MKPAEYIKKLFRTSQITVSPDTDDRILTDAISALHSCGEGRPTENIWRNIMKSTTVKLATAAVIIVSILVGVNHFGGSIDGSAVAWAQVAEKVEQIQAFAYRMKMNMKGLPNMPNGQDLDAEMEILSSEFGMLMEMSTEVSDTEKIIQKIYIPLQEESMVILMPEQKQYLRMRLTDDLLAKMREESGDPKSFIREHTKGEYIELGRKTIDGIEVEGIEANDQEMSKHMNMGGIFDNVVARLWVNIETELPVLLELETSSNDGKTQMTMVMDDFQWDISIDAEAFTPEIPDDYRLLADVQLPTADAEGLIKGFDGFAKLTGGKYPKSMDMMEIMEEASVALRERMGDDPNYKPGDPPPQELVQEMMTIQMVSMSYHTIAAQEKDPVYYGDKVTTEFGHAVLMRWKAEDDMYTVIFGDLTTEDVSAERLAELEAVPLNLEPYAIKPQPAEGSTGAELKLSWMPGAYVTQHQIYMGTSPDQMEMIAETDEAFLNELGSLESGTDYYWRVDEVQPDGSIVTGDVWDFNTGGLHSQWTFDEDISDASGNGFDGAFNNMGDDSLVDEAIYFDGSGGYVSIPPLNLNSNNVTIAAWIKRDSEQIKADAGILYSRDAKTIAGIKLGHTADWQVNNNLGYEWGNQKSTWNWDSGLFVPGDQWVFVVLVVEPERATLYVNDGSGMQSAVNEVAHAAEEFDGNTFIGKDSWDQRFYKGSIDDVSIYSYSLQQDELESLYQDSPYAVELVPITN